MPFPYCNLKGLGYKYSDCFLAHWKLIARSHQSTLNQLALHFPPSFLADNAYYFAAHSGALIMTLPKTKRQFLINTHILSHGKELKEASTY